MWVSAAGTTYRAGADDFINAQVPLYYSGSWQIANLSTKIGDGFDWVAIGQPLRQGRPARACRAARRCWRSSTPRTPRTWPRSSSYLARQDVVKEFSERTLFLPAHKGGGRRRRASVEER